MLAEALFVRIDAPCFREATLHLSESAIAHGFAAVFQNGSTSLLDMVGARGFEPPCPTPRIVVPAWVAEAMSRSA
jgi:hypothetical protein